MLNIISYLLGSIPLSVWLGKLIKGIDLRNHGSGGTGATNTFRILGTEIGLVILVFDVLKGIALPLILFLLNIHLTKLEILTLGVYTVLGHIYPIFSNFKGGKGVATIFGLISILYPVSATISLVIFILMFIKFNYVSLASLTSSFCVPLTVFLFYKTLSDAELMFVILVPILITLTHRTNILRLFKKQEPKFKLGR